METGMNTNTQTTDISPERKAVFMSLIESIFGPRPNHPQRCRRNIRELYPTFTKDISEVLEKLLVLMKKYEFTMFAHEKLLLLCENFNSIMNVQEKDHLIIALNQLSNSEINPETNIETNLESNFKIGLSEWIDTSIHFDDKATINNNKEEFSFLM